MRRVAVIAAAGAAAGLAAVSAPAAAQVLGPDAAACAAGKTALLVRVTGLETRGRLLRVSTYRATAAEWLESGRYIRRIDVDVPAAGDATVCVALPGPGQYGVGVLHDKKGDGKLNPFRDGYGVSNNPRLGFSKPDVAKAAFAAGAGVTAITIKVNR